MLPSNLVDSTTALQSLITDLTAETVTDAVDELVNSEWATSLSHVDSIASAIMVAANIRPLQIPLLARFAARLSAAASSDNALAEFASCLFQLLIRCCCYTDTFPHEASSISFLFHAFESGVFTIDEIVTLLHHLVTEPKFGRSASWVFAYFAPEVETADHRLFKKLLTRLQKCASNRRFPQMLKKFSDQFDHYRNDHWHRLKKSRNFFNDTDQLLTHLRHDNVESLALLAQHPDFCIDKRLAPTPFLPSPALMSHPTLLQITAFFGAPRCFRWLLSAGADLRLCDRRFATLGQLAVAGGDPEIVRLIQQHDLDLSSTAHSAARYHRHSLFEWLLTDPNEPDLFGERPLHAACATNNAYAISTLLARGADANAESDYRRWTPLRVAVRNRSLASIRLLLSVPGIVTVPVSPDVLSPVCLAVKHGDSATVALLLSGGASASGAVLAAVQHRRASLLPALLDCAAADPNEANRVGTTPLIALAGLGCEAALLLAGHPRVDVNRRSAEGSTALLYAVRRGDAALFRALLARPETDVGLTFGGATLLHFAAQSPAMVAALLARGGIDVNAVDGARETALHRAVVAGNWETIEELLRQPTIDVNVQSALGGTPLQYALCGRKEEIAVRLIADRKVDVNRKTEECAPAIAIAISEKLKRCVRALCGREDLDVTGKIRVKNAAPPLVLACCLGDADAVECLLRCAKMNVENPACGVKAARVAALRLGRADCASLLRPQRQEKQTVETKRREKIGFFRRLRRWRSGLITM